jgi:signal transduction histidine kinase
LIVPEEPIIVDADRHRLRQIIVNLLANATKYTDPGGDIAVSASSTGTEACLKIRDSGVGIAPELLPHVFDLFKQAQAGEHGGLGIGLSLVHSLVQLHGGIVTVASAGPGKGSEFCVRLPLSDRHSGRREEITSAILQH